MYCSMGLGTIQLPPYNPPNRSAPNEPPLGMGRNELGVDNTPIIDARQLEYLEWLVTPVTERIPRYQKDIANKLGVDVTTLRRWEKKPHFKTEWDKRVNEIQGSPERTQRLLDALYEKALKGDNRAAQLYLQATNRLVTAPTVIQTVTPAELSDEELDQLLSSSLESEKRRRSGVGG